MKLLSPGLKPPGGHEIYPYSMNIKDLHLEHKHYSLAERSISVKHFREIWRVLRELINHTNQTELAQMTTHHIRSFLIFGRVELGWSVKTFHNYRQYLSSFFKWAGQRGYVKTNPVDAIEKPRLDKRIPRYLNRQDARKILFCATWYPWRYEFQKLRNPTIIATFLMTGIRLKELINLSLEDVDLAAGEILVRKGKGRKDRLVPVHDRLHRHLQVYLKARIKKTAQWSSFFPGLFTGKPLQPRDIRAICRKVGMEASVKFTPHMLRHTFAREMVENDFPIYKLQEILGHSSITTTQIYLSASRSSIRKSFRSVSMY